MANLLLSLCIPTNGVAEWVEPVLKSIYEGISDYSEFEVIVTDNGNNSEFGEAMMDFARRHANFRYYKTESDMFLNQIEAFKLAKGQLIKFVNHRILLRPGAVEYLIEYAAKHIGDKPVVYFTNGVLKRGNEQHYASFNDYICGLSYWSSWSAGTAMWKSDFDKMNLDREYSRLFPHTDMLFFNRNAKEYIINDRHLMDELPADITKKGKYDLFGAFAVEYPRIIEALYKENAISLKTFNKVLRDNGRFVNKLYFDYVVRKKPCSYDLSGFDKAVGVYYSEKEICGGRILNFVEMWMRKALG